jgi:hypothetical protein
MAGAIRITPEETFRKLHTGKALLVCAYDSEERFSSLHLDGAISLSAFRVKLAAIPKDQEIVFYCA